MPARAGESPPVSNTDTNHPAAIKPRRRGLVFAPVGRVITHKTRFNGGWYHPPLNSIGYRESSIGDRLDRCSWSPLSPPKAPEQGQ